MTHSLPPSESLTVEFKSDRRKLSDAELVEALVCLANTESGKVWVGMEDNGEPTGSHVEHRARAGLPGCLLSDGLKGGELDGNGWNRMRFIRLNRGRD